MEKIPLPKERKQDCQVLSKGKKVDAEKMQDQSPKLASFGRCKNVALPKPNTQLKSELLLYESGKHKCKNNFYLRIAETTPAPTVLPPSLIAKRIPFSIAMG